MFVCRWDSAGSLIWAADAGSSLNQQGNAVVTDNDAVYVTGRFQASFFRIHDGGRGPSAGQLLNSGGDDIFVIAFEKSNGNLKWAQAIASSLNEEGNSITVTNGYVIVAGNSEATTVSFPNSPPVSVSGVGNNDQEMLLAALDTASGNAVWARISAGNDLQNARGVDHDSSGNIWVSGEYRRTFFLTPSDSLISVGQGDVFLAKYEVASGNYQESYRAGDPDQESGNGIACSVDSRVFVGGHFHESIEFPPLPLSPLHPNNDNLFIARFGEAITAASDSSCTFEGQARSLFPLSNDNDGLTANLVIDSILSLPQNGTAIIVDDTTINYTPNPGYAGFDSLQYLVCKSIALCDSAWIMIEITPIADAGSDTSLCAQTSFTLMGNDPNPGFGNWIAISGSGTVSSPNDPTSVVTGLTTGINVLEWRITAAGCSSSDSVLITVNDLPTVSFSGLNSPICIDAAPLTLTPAPTGGTFSGNGITGNLFDPAVAGAATHSIVYTYTDTATGCTNADTQAIVVNPLPIVSFSGFNSPVCIDAAPITLTPAPTGGTFSGNGITGNLFDPAVAGAATHSIVYTFTDTTTGCTNADTQAIVVNPLPIVSFSGLPAATCLNGVLIALAPSPQGGVFSGNGITAAQFDPAAAGVATHTIIYTYTDTATGCTNADTQSIIVHPLPPVSFSLQDSMFCEGEGGVVLNGTPAPGQFFGNGVVGNEFFPTVSGLGTFNLIYTYIDGNGCAGRDTQMVRVTDVPPLSVSGLDSAYCEDNVAVSLTGSPSGGIFTGTGVSRTTFTPSLSGPGQHLVTYLFTTPEGCTDSLRTPVTVFALPVPDLLGLDPSYCIADDSIPLVGLPPGGTFTGPGISGAWFLPAAAGAGTHILGYTYTSPEGCTAGISATTQVDALPDPVFAGPDQIILVGNRAQLNASLPQLGSGSWQSTGGTVEEPSVVAPLVKNLKEGENRFQWQVENGNCVLMDETVVTLIPSFPEKRGISPNQDGANDALRFAGLENYPGSHLRIITRWGTQVYESEDYQNDWKGLNQNGQELPDDTYYFVLELPEQVKYSGFVVLKR